MKTTVDVTLIQDLKIWGPWIPGEIFGRTAEGSKPYFQVGPRTGVECRAGTSGCMGARTLVAVEVACINLLFFVAKVLLHSSQLSGKINWTYELSKLYGWVHNQKYLWDNQNSQKTKKSNHGLQSFQLSIGGHSAHQG